MVNGREDMTEPNEPDKKNEETESTKEEAPIELKEETTDVQTGDEEIIDLLEAVEEQEPIEDEAIIELEEKVAEEPKEDDDIIDLTEAAEDSPKEVKDDSIDAKEEKTEEDDTIIDLNVKISPVKKEIEDIGEPIADDTDIFKEYEDVDDFDGNLIKETVDFTDELDASPTMDDALKDDFAGSLGVELDTKDDISGDIFESDKITDEKFEAALERVIKKVYHEKIDRLLLEAIEKTVTREIEKLKKALLEDASDGDK